MRRIGIVSLIVFLIAIALSGCFEEKKEKNYTETFYPSGALKSKKWFWKEGVFVDTAFYYFENGNYSSIDILNDSGVLHGVSKKFYENGNIEQIINYTMGVKDGFLYSYTYDGHLDTKNYYLNNKMAGDVFGYNTKGQINYYGFYDFKERNLNLITYDSLTGKPIKNMYQDIFIDSVVFNTGIKNDSLSIQLLISNPPYRRSTVRVDYLSGSGRIIKSDSISGLPYFLIKQKMSDSLYALNFSGSQFDSLTSTIQTQSDKKILTKKY